MECTKARKRKTNRVWLHSEAKSPYLFFFLRAFVRFFQRPTRTMLKQACYAVVDTFTDLSGSDSKRRELYMELVSSMLALLIAIAIVAFVGKWLWNNIVIDLFNFARPARSVWQIIGLMIFLGLIR
jgi:hypothetical protein